MTIPNIGSGSTLAHGNVQQFLVWSLQQANVLDSKKKHSCINVDFEVIFGVIFQAPNWS